MQIYSRKGPGRQLPSDRQVGVEPQFQPERINPVQIVPKQPLVSDKAEVLVELQGGLVGHLRLENHLVRAVGHHDVDGLLD